MFKFRNRFCFVVLVCFTSTCFAQQHFAKTLLWRISGNGLQKPSYLFGTMHLTDKRLFNFTDSVYKAIENTQGLAIEVNPDEMIAYFINKMFDELEKGKKVEDILDQEDYKKLSPALEKKFGKPAGEITAHDVVKEKNKWMIDYLQKGEMPTFVDAYLYNIAKKQGKWIGGIEDVSDQAGLLDDMVDKSDIKYMLADEKPAGDNTVEKMITTYSSQDIEAIESLTNAGTSAEMKDKLLINRNIKMARRIDSLAAFRTMFFAIGAAHLPGDSGVIRLLQSRGFTVEPVISNKKIASSDYTFKEIDIPWTEVKDEQGLYKVDMPGNPVPVKLFGLMDIKFLFDLSNFSGFYTMAVISPKDLTNKDSLFGEMAKRMFKNQKITPPKKLMKDGIDGREFIQMQDGMTLRVQIYLTGKIVYMVMAYALKKENISSANAERFFKSFTINQVIETNAAASAFTDSVMGISFVSPVPVVLNSKLSQESNNGWKISAFNGADISTGSYIMLFSKEVKAGNSISTDSAVYSQFFQLLQKQYTNIRIKDTAIQGLKVVTAGGRNMLQNLYVRIFNTILGNRNIVLLSIGDSASLSRPPLTDVFNSFRFLPRPYIPWKQYAATNNMFTSWAPSQFRDYVSTADEKRQQLCYDTSTATSYVVLADTLSKYSWAQSDTAFWTGQIHAYTLEDSLVANAAVKNDGLAGREILIKKRSSGNTFKRVRMLLDGNIVYNIVVSSDSAMLYQDNTDKFFTGFHVVSPQKENFLNGSKAQVLLNDLLSSDSATRYAAYSAMRSAPFGTMDIPALNEALFKNYPSLYDSTDATIINMAVGRSLEKLASSSSVTFIKEKYNTFKGDKEFFKNTALSALAGMHTKESYDAFAELFIKSPPTENLNYGCIISLTDSLQLTAAIYPTLLPLLKDTFFTLAIARISLRLIDSGLTDIKTIAPFEKDILTSADAMLAGIRNKTTDDIGYDTYHLIELLGKFKTPGSFKALSNYLTVASMYLRKKAAEELIKNDQVVPMVTLNGLAADVSTRSTFYSDLKDMGKASLFPAQYLTQQYFAQGAVYLAATENDDEDESSDARVGFLSKKTSSFKGKNYTFYLYKVSFGEGDDETSYLGVAGGYAIGGTSLEAKEDATGLYWKEKYDAGNIAAQFDAYLKNLTEPQTAEE